MFWCGRSVCVCVYASFHHQRSEKAEKRDGGDFLHSLSPDIHLGSRWRSLFEAGPSIAEFMISFNSVITFSDFGRSCKIRLCYRYMFFFQFQAAHEST